MTLREFIERTIPRISPVSDSARLDTEVLAMHALRLTRAQLITRASETLSSIEIERAEQLARRRAEGEPVAYITETREFWSLDLKVTPSTLIPRPETERLVELALERIPVDTAVDILDLGTGSGAIALAIAHERPRARVVATDVSAEALAVARENAARHRIENIEFRQGSWFAPLKDMIFDVIVSNPPYVREHDPHLQNGDVRYEPRGALVSGSDGLDDIRHIVSNARPHLRTDGFLFVEHGHDQAEHVAAIYRQYRYQDLSQFTDLGNHSRVATAQYGG